MGLNSGGVQELYEQVRAEAAEQGCTCGVVSIYPRPGGRSKRQYEVGLVHDPTCPMHPMQVRHKARVEAEERDKAERKLTTKLKRLFTRR